MDSMPISSKPSTNVDSIAAAEAFTPMTHLSRSEADSLIRKIVHPPTCQEIAGLPSGGARSQVVLELKQLKSMARPLVFGPTTVTLVPNDISARFAPSLLVLNGARVAAAQFIYDGTSGGAYSGDTYQDVANVYYNDSLDFDTWATNTNLFRLIYKSTTVTLNSTMFNDVGIVAAFQFTPSLLFSGTLAKFLDTNRAAALKFINDVFSRVGCVKIPEKGFVTISDANPDFQHEYHAIHSDHHHFEQAKKMWSSFPKSVRADIAESFNTSDFAVKNKIGIEVDPGKYVLSLNPDSNIQILNLNNSGTGVNSYAPTINQVVSTGRDYSTDAKEGCFMVQRLTQPNVQWLNATRTSGRADTPIPYLYGCYVFTNAGSTYVPLYEQQNTPGTARNTILRDTAWTDQMTMGWIVFDGLCPNVFAESGTFFQMLNIKSITGIEVQNTVSGAYAPLAKPGPIQDEAVMERILFTLNEFKDGMPASFNSWGMLASLAGNVISNVAPKLINRFLTPKSAKFISSFLKPNSLVVKSVKSKNNVKEIIKKDVKKEVKKENTPMHQRRPNNGNSKTAIREIAKMVEKMYPRERLPPAAPLPRRRRAKSLVAK
jgi:hypothetical protein